MKHIYTKWWFWFILLIIVSFVFVKHTEKKEQIANSSEHTTNKSDEGNEEIETKSEFIRVFNQQELNAFLANQEKQQTEIIQNNQQEKPSNSDENKIKQEKQKEELLEKWEVKNGNRLTTNLSIERFIDMFMQKMIVINPSYTIEDYIINSEENNLDYRYDLAENIQLQIQVQPKEHQLKRMLLHTKTQQKEEAEQIISSIISILSPEIKEEEQKEYLEELFNGRITKFQSNRGIIYEYQQTDENIQLAIWNKYDTKFRSESHD